MQSEFNYDIEPVTSQDKSRVDLSRKGKRIRVGQLLIYQKMGAYTSAAKKAAILDAHQMGKSKSEIARDLGITRNTVQKTIRNGLVSKTRKKPSSNLTYPEFYTWAEAKIKGGIPLMQVYKSYDGDKPSWPSVYNWVKRSNLSPAKGKKGFQPLIVEVSFNKELHSLLQRRLVSTMVRLKPLYKNPLYKEELVAEMSVIALQYHLQYDPLSERLPDEAMRAASSAADKLLTLLGYTKTEERKAAVLQAQEWATFDYETRDGQVLKQVFTAYQLFGMRGVLNEIIPNDIIMTEKLLKQFCPKKI